LCGTFVVRVDGDRIENAMPGRQGRLLFAYLAAQPSRTAGRDELADALWPGELPSAPGMALSALLSKLRRLLGDRTIEGRSEIRLNLQPDAWIDLECARGSVHRAQAALEGGRHWDAYAAAVTARYISERPFMRGESAPWIDATRRELEEINLRAIEADARASLALGGAESHVAERSARKLIELAPDRESGYCLLMRALDEAGNPAEALRVYEDLRTRLRDELGTTPSPDAQRVHAELLATSNNVNA
jgi:DNA-binding SARP family transcriptional activator